MLYIKVLRPIAAREQQSQRRSRWKKDTVTRKRRNAIFLDTADERKKEKMKSRGTMRETEREGGKDAGMCVYDYRYITGGRGYVGVRTKR